MIDVYFSISKQYRKYADKDYDILGSSLKAIGYESDEFKLRKFSSSVYTSCENEVRYPDFMVTSLPHIGKLIGKGSYIEIEYARDNDIPVFVIIDVDSKRKMFLVDYAKPVYENDWVMHARITLYDEEPIGKQRMKAIFSNFNIDEPKSAKDRWIRTNSPVTEEIEETVDQSENILFLL